MASELPPDSNRGWTRAHLSPNHLHTAYILAEQSRQIEQIGDKERAALLTHRSYVCGSIMSSVAFVEASINELYAICAEQPNDIHIAGHPTDDRFRDIGQAAREKIAALWTIESFRRYASVLEKCQTALHLSEKEKFDQGNNPYQDAKLVIQLRNTIVHFVPEQREIAVGEGNHLPPDDLEKKYKGKFTWNPLMAKYAVIGGDPADYPFFPEKCLGSSCALWAYQSMLEFTDGLFSRLGTTWYHHYLFDREILPRNT
jgi:hypothetical protein